VKIGFHFDREVFLEYRLKSADEAPAAAHDVTPNVVGIFNQGLLLPRAPGVTVDCGEDGRQLTGRLVAVFRDHGAVLCCMPRPRFLQHFLVTTAPQITQETRTHTLCMAGAPFPVPPKS
jgi:hypothetical protein